jgi:glycosyltransferase 2 family protein
VIRVAVALGLIGLGGAVALFVFEGVGPVFAICASGGFGIVLAALFHLAPMALNGRAWQLLLPPRNRNGFVTFLSAVWIREAVNGLLPVARIGGEVAAAQFLTGRGLRPSRAIASLLVDMTASLGSQTIFTLVGVALLLAGNRGQSLIRLLILVSVIALVLGGAFWFAQRRGMFRLLARLVRSMFGDRFATLQREAAPLDRAVRALYRRRSGFAACFLWQILGWFGGAGEIGLALYFLGQQGSLGEAVIIEAVIQALSSVAFIVPGAIGVQEGGFVAIGSLVGLPPDVALALALFRRARDVIVFAPALAAWQFNFGRWLWARI